MPVFILPPAATAANCSGGPQPDVERSRRLWRASLPQEVTSLAVSSYR